MIQAIMLIALGFLTASLIGVLLAPSLWSRAYRLARKQLEKTLPLTLAEIEATHDQLRASYAVRLRRLEAALASAKQKAALQLVDNSRLQMQIAALKDQIGELDLNLSERRNAATVLEQTITKRFPELDREIAAVRAQLQERSYDLQDLTNRLGRRDEELAGAERAAASYEEELGRLRQALEKGSGDRSGRRLRRASQWDLDDYRAEYDRLNLELSKLRQQLAQLQDKDTQQVGVIKGELQKLAELILISTQPKADSKQAERPEVSTRRPGGPDLRRDRPVPWLQPVPVSTLLQSEQDKARAAAAVEDSAIVPLSEQKLSQPHEAAPLIGSTVLSSVLGTLPDEGGLKVSAANDPGEAGESRSGQSGGRPSLLEDVVADTLPEPSGDVQAPTEPQRFLGPNGAAGHEGSVDAGKSQAGTPELTPSKPENDGKNIEDRDMQPLPEVSARSSGNGAEHGADETKVNEPSPALDLDEADSPSQNRTLLDRLRGVSERSVKADK